MRLDGNVTESLFMFIQHDSHHEKVWRSSLFTFPAAVSVLCSLHTHCCQAETSHNLWKQVFMYKAVSVCETDLCLYSLLKCDFYQRWRLASVWCKEFSLIFAVIISVIFLLGTAVGKKQHRARGAVKTKWLYIQRCSGGVNELLFNLLSRKLNYSAGDEFHFLKIPVEWTLNRFCKLNMKYWWNSGSYSSS